MKVSQCACRPEVPVGSPAKGHGAAGAGARSAVDEYGKLKRRRERWHVRVEGLAEERFARRVVSLLADSRPLQAPLPLS